MNKKIILITLILLILLGLNIVSAQDSASVAFFVGDYYDNNNTQFTGNITEDDSTHSIAISFKKIGSFGTASAGWMYSGDDAGNKYDSIMGIYNKDVYINANGGDGNLYLLGYGGLVLNDSQWYTAIATYSGTTRNLYLYSDDGYDILANDTDTASTTLYHTGRIVGQRYDGAEDFVGYLQNYTEWNYTLSTTEISNFFLYGDTAETLTTGVPTINQSTYNQSTAIDAGNTTVWRTNISTPSWSFDTTPTIKFNTNISANCRLSTTNVNWSSMNSSMNCGTTGGTSQVCSLWTALSIDDQYQSLYTSCSNVNNATRETALSTSGALNLSLAVFNFSGTTKDAGGTAIENASVFIMYQDNNTQFLNLTSDASGLWSSIVNITDTSIKYLIYGYDPDNSSRAADIKHFVTVP